MTHSLAVRSIIGGLLILGVVALVGGFALNLAYAQDDTSAPVVETVTDPAPADAGSVDTTVTDTSTSDTSATDAATDTTTDTSTSDVSSDTSTDTSTAVDATTSTTDTTTVTDPTPVPPPPSPELSFDKDDYHPGGLVTIFGKFFTAAQTYILKIFGSDENDQNYTESVQNVTADANGNFTGTYTLDNLYRPFYQVIASTVNGTTVAQSYFRDSSIGTYDQCSNDLGTGYTSGNLGCRWINGNLNSNNSTYFEGDATVQRMWIEGYAPGSTHTVTFSYGTTKGGHHAYDYLTTWNASENWVLPADRCEGITGCDSASDVTLAMQDDPILTNTIEPATTTRFFTARGATLNSVTVPALASGSYAGDSETVVTVSFTLPASGPMCSTKGNVTSCGVAIWFAGHVAKTSEWQAVDGTTGAGSISGSPYHVALSAEDGASIGNRDNQMQSNTLPSVITIRKVTDPQGDPQSFTFTTSGNGQNYNGFNLTGGNSNTQTVSPSNNHDTFIVTEGAVAQWTLTNLTCQDNNTASTQTINLAGRQATIVLDKDSSTVVECTFTNTKQQKVPAPVTTAIHDAAHATVTSVPAGTTVHDSVSVAGTPTPTGNVTFDFFNNSSCTGTPAATSGTFALSGGAVDATTFTQGPLAVGSYGFLAHYAGDANFTPTDGTCEPLTVTKVTPSISTTPGAGGVIGTTLNDTATVSGGYNPTGGVTFKLFPPSDATCSGVASYTDTDTAAPYATSPGFASNAVGIWHWTADYAGDANNNPVSSACTEEAVTVTKATPSLSTTIHDASHAATTTVALGSTVHDSASISGGSNPTGNVDFTFYQGDSCTGDSVSAGSVALSGGVADPSSDEGPLAAGLYSFKAHYVGDNSNNAADAACEPLTVNKARLSITTTVHDAAHATIANNAHVPLGTVAHDNAAVTGAVSGFPIPAISFTFDSGAIANDSTEGSFSATSVATSALAAGAHKFNATVGDNANYIGATSADEPFTVDKADTTVTTAIHLGSDHTTDVQDTNIALNSSIHDKATVGTQVDSLAIGGNVTYKFYNSNNCTGDQIGGDDTVAVGNESSAHNNLNAGDYSFLASYSGDSNYNASTATCEKVHVNKAPLSIATTIHDAGHSATTSVGLGSIVHDTASVSGQVGSITPTGAVTFTFGPTCGTGAIATDGSLDSGNPRSVDTSALAAGSYNFQATVAGDSNYDGATSDCEPLTVNKAQLGITTTVHDAAHATIATNAHVPLGTVAHDNAQVTGGVSGFAIPGVSFTFDGGAIASTTAEGGFDSTSVETSALAAGAHKFNATIESNDNYIGATSDDEPFTVDKAQLSVTTYVHDAAHADKTGAMVPLNSVMHDTATTTGGVSGFTLPATSFTLTSGYTNSCAAGAAVANNGTESGAVKSADSAALAAGMYAYRAVVAGDDNYLGATGACESFQVINPHTTISIVPNTQETVAGENVVLTISDTNDGDVPLTNASAVLTYGATTVTLDKNSANFSGDTNSDGIMDPGETWTWTVSVLISSNTTFTVVGHGTDPLGNDITPDNGYSTETASTTVTVITTTRTLGFWQTHTSFTSAIFSTFFPSGMPIGSISPDCTVPANCSATHKGSITNNLAAGQSELFGGFYAGIAQKASGKGKNAQRSDVDKARMILLQQLLAAKLNCAAFGCTSTTQANITAADAAYLAGDKNAILNYASILDAYNNSLDSGAIPPSLPPTGKATPSASKTAANLSFWDTP